MGTSVSMLWQYAGTYGMLCSLVADLAVMYIDQKYQ